jgi:hypothetical protein
MLSYISEMPWGFFRALEMEVFQFPLIWPSIQNLHGLMPGKYGRWGVLRTFRRRNSSTARCSLRHIKFFMSTEKLIAGFWRENAFSHSATMERCSERNILGCISALEGEHPAKFAAVL